MTPKEKEDLKALEKEARETMKEFEQMVGHTVLSMLVKFMETVKEHDRKTGRLGE